MEALYLQTCEVTVSSNLVFPAHLRSGFYMAESSPYKEGSTTEPAIEGLVRIAGNEAAEILIRALKTQSSRNAKELIRSALERMGQESSDPLLKDKIRVFLHSDRTG